MQAFEYDRRFSKTLPTLSIDPVLRTRILKLIQAEEQEIDRMFKLILHASCRNNVRPIHALFAILQLTNFARLTKHLIKSCYALG
jgi:hypothetical protein